MILKTRVKDRAQHVAMERSILGVALNRLDRFLELGLRYDTMPWQSGDSRKFARVILGADTVEHMQTIHHVQRVLTHVDINSLASHEGCGDGPCRTTDDTA